jgi:hypothetical protein
MLTVHGVARSVAVAAVVAAILVVSGSDAVARPKYLTVVNSKYEDLAKKVGTDGKLTCALCHPTKDNAKKMIRNNYGAAVGKGLEKKNETDEEKIKKALEKAESEKSATDDKTFGDLIKDGTLPGTDEPAK